MVVSIVASEYFEANSLCLTKGVCVWWVDQKTKSTFGTDAVAGA